MLSLRDKERLNGVHHHLVTVVAETSVLLPKKYPGLSLFVIFGLRTRQQQYELWRMCHEPDGSPNGEAWKTNFNGTPKGQRSPEGSWGTGVSRHQSGNAVDLGVNNQGKLTWDAPAYEKLADVMLAIAAKHNIPMVWGGSFKRRDLVHYELNQKFYP